MEDRNRTFPACVAIAAALVGALVAGPSSAHAATFTSRTVESYVDRTTPWGPLRVADLAHVDDTGAPAMCLDSAADAPDGHDYPADSPAPEALRRIVTPLARGRGWPGLDGDELRSATQIALWMQLGQMRSEELTPSAGVPGSRGAAVLAGAEALCARNARNLVPIHVTFPRLRALPVDGYMLAGPFRVGPGDTSAMSFDVTAPADVTVRDGHGASRTTFSCDEPFFLAVSPQDADRSMEATVTVAWDETVATVWDAPAAGVQHMLTFRTEEAYDELPVSATFTKLTTKVVFADGAPAAGVELTVVNEKTGLMTTVVTTEDGTAALFGLEPGTFRVSQGQVPARYLPAPCVTLSLGESGAGHAVFENALAHAVVPAPSDEPTAAAPAPGTVDTRPPSADARIGDPAPARTPAPATGDRTPIWALVACTATSLGGIIASKRVRPATV